MALLVVSLTALLIAASALITIEVREASRWRRTAQTVELRFGRDLAPEAVIGMLEQLGAARAGVVILDLAASHHGVRHLVTTDRTTLDRLRASLRALSPSSRLVPAQLPDGPWTAGRGISLGGRLQTLRDKGIAESSAALLAAAQPLAPSEHLLLRWVIRPGRPQQVPRVEHGVAVEPEDRRRLRLKNDGGIVLAHGIVLAAAAGRARSLQLLSQLTTVLRTRSTAYGRLVLLPRAPWRLRSLPAKSYGWRRGNRYAATELAGLLGWPFGGPQLPGVALGTSPLLLPSGRLPRRGRIIGTATWPDDPRPIAQPLVGALSHSLITGPTGVGKSTLLLHLLSADVREGRGLVLIDGKGDTARELLARIPKRRASHVIVLDCASDGPLPGLRLFSGTDSSLAADVVLGVLADLFKDSWGPLSERYLRAGLMAVAQDPAGTLADVPFVFSDAAYRRRLVGRLRDPMIRSAFAGFEAMSPGERQHQLAAPLGKLGQLLGRPVVRTVLGQAAPQLDFTAALRRQQIVVISLAPARVGSAAARLVGALSVFGLFQAVQSRSELPASERRPFLAYIDEPKALGDLPMPLDALFEQARGLGVGLTLAPQSMAQLPKAVREAALTNAATRIAFRQQADDARLLARDLAGVTPDDLQDLGAYEVVARIGLGPGDVAPPVTVRTAPPPRQLGDPRELRQRSELKYGMTLEDVDDALQARHEASPESAPIGRKRRTS